MVKSGGSYLPVSNFLDEAKFAKATMHRWLLVLMAAGNLLPARATDEPANAILILADD
jgi:hypothetical protein